MMFCMLLVTTIACMFAQSIESLVIDSIAKNVAVISEEIHTEYTSYFATFAALVALVPIVVEAFKRWFPKMNSTWTQIVSWIIGVIIVYFGWFFNLGCLMDLNWWQTLLYGIGVSLAANGIADTGIIEWIVNLFCSKANILRYNEIRKNLKE